MEPDLEIVFNVEGQGILKETALLAKEQSISLEEIQVFALNVKREHIGLTTVTPRRTVKEISSPGQKTGGGACPGPPKLKCTGP